MSNSQSSSQNRRARDKIKSLAELAEIAGVERVNGRALVLAHGTFDLLHMGHVRHLEEARSHGDLLIVTVTADRHVNKGPGRPVFPQQLRAEMLAALSYVDWVAINEAPTAEPVILALQPNFYAKGSDYVVAEDDVTGKITDERIAVERHGGRIIFTDDITFSSSELINRHLDVHDPEVREYLAQARHGDGLGRLIQMVESVADMRVLVIGDTILDEYQYVNPSGQPSKEHIIATRHSGSELFAGGAIAAANTVAGFCREVELVTCLGEGDENEAFIQGNLKPNVTLTPLHRPGAPTTRKLRFVDTAYLRKLFEVQFIDDSPLPQSMQRHLDRLIRERAPSYDAVICADFGHGLIGAKTVATICDTAWFLAVSAQTNSANRGFNLVTKYPRADYICIDEPEARLAMGDRVTDLQTIARQLMPKRIDCPRMILTHGRYGCATYQKGRGTTRIPAITNQVVDTMGAGDAFLSVTAPIAAAGGAMADVGLIGNIAGAIKVGIVGHRASVDRVGVIKALTALLK